MAITASPDGRRIYVGGDFTQVNGKIRNRLAVFSAATGELLTDFQPGVNGTVRALQTIGDVVYAGGLFTSTGGNPRNRLAAFSATNGALLTCAGGEPGGAVAAGVAG
ncbi:MAG: laminin G, partial [Kineosporiaceae bacterium]|nr:laminin G [Kineosporiaceae bacterium]